MRQQLTAVLIILCNRFMVTKAVQCRTKFESQRVCPVTYGTVLIQTGNIQSHASCSIICSSDDSCRSYTYDSSTHVCETNSKMASFFSNGCTVKVHYGQLVKGTCQDSWLFRSCTDSLDCIVPNSACISNVCTCDNGYSYRYKTDSCHGLCAEYGTTFKEEHYYIHGLNMKTLFGISLEQCKNECLIHDVTCRFVEHYLSPEIRCQLSSATGFTNPESLRLRNNRNNAKYFQFLRNCH